jgi:L-rhamnonate dehydratase
MELAVADMSLTVPYAIKLCQALSPIGLKWMEEYVRPHRTAPSRAARHTALQLSAARALQLMPDDYAGHVSVKEALRATPVMLATAEHEYTRYGYKQLIDSGSVDVLQPDITWLGGITEARRVIAMASASNLPVVPHGSSVFSYHGPRCTGRARARLPRFRPAYQLPLLGSDGCGWSSAASARCPGQWWRRSRTAR